MEDQLQWLQKRAPIEYLSLSRVGGAHVTASEFECSVDAAGSWVSSCNIRMDRVFMSVHEFILAEPFLSLVKCKEADLYILEPR